MWRISKPGEDETKYRTALGDQEYERRLAIANKKADELHAAGSWEEAMILRPLFQDTIMNITPGTLAKAENLNGRAWAKIIYRLTGVNESTQGESTQRGH
jgi:hypothetical protein